MGKNTGFPEAWSGVANRNKRDVRAGRWASRIGCAVEPLGHANDRADRGELGMRFLAACWVGNIGRGGHGLRRHGVGDGPKHRRALGSRRVR